MKDDSNAIRNQSAILVLLVAAYMLLATTYVTKGRAPLLIVGPLLFTAAFVIARVLGANTSGGSDIIAVMFTGLMAFVMPLTLDPPIEGMAFGTAFLGFLTTEAIWAVVRFPTRRMPHPDSFLAAARRDLRMGIAMAAVLSCVALAITLYALIRYPGGTIIEAASILGIVVASYFVGATVASLCVAALRRLLSWPLGVMLAGAFAGVAVYAAIGPGLALIDHFDGKPWASASQTAAIAIICGLALGPAVGLSWAWSGSPKHAKTGE